MSEKLTFAAVCKMHDDAKPDAEIAAAYETLSINELNAINDAFDVEIQAIRARRAVLNAVRHRKIEDERLALMRKKLRGPLAKLLGREPTREELLEFASADKAERQAKAREDRRTLAASLGHDPSALTDQQLHEIAVAHSKRHRTPVAEGEEQVISVAGVANSHGLAVPAG